MIGECAFLDVPGACLRYRVDGAGPTVALVHGWALDLDLWSGQFAALAGDYRVLAWDRRGFGWSTGEPGLDADVDDLERLLAHVDADRVSIVGMSQGARVALRWASRFADRTSCLVLDGPPAGAGGEAVEEQTEIPTAKYRRIIRTDGIDAFRRRWRDHPLMRLYSRDPQSHETLERMAARYPAHDLLADAAPESHRDVSAAALRLPVLIINGQHDTAVRHAAALELLRTLGNARRTVIPAAGHLASLDNPGAYNAAVSDFLALHRTRMPDRSSDPLASGARTHGREARRRHRR